MPLDVRKSPELAAAILAMSQAERSLTRNINKDARQTVGPTWKQAVARRAAGSALASKVLNSGARVAFSDRQVSLRAAGSTRALRGGLVPTHEWAGVELGMTPKRVTFTAKSPKGKRYQVTKTVGRQFPARRGTGRAVFPAAGEVGHKIVAGWLLAVIDGFRRHPLTVED